MRTRATLTTPDRRSRTCEMTTIPWPTAILLDSRLWEYEWTAPPDGAPDYHASGTASGGQTDATVEAAKLAYAPVSAYDSASSTSYAQLQAVGLQAGNNAIYYSNATADLPGDKFMQGVGEMVSSGLKSVGNPLPVTVDASSVSAHDRYGNSLRITGNANGVDVALSQGKNGNTNTLITWNAANRWVQYQTHGPGRPYTSPGALVLPYRIRMTLWGVMTTGEIGGSP